MCFGFLGIQFGFALQNANVSRIFQTLGAEHGRIPILWIAAPLTGLLVQPISRATSPIAPGPALGGAARISSYGAIARLASRCSCMPNVAGAVDRRRHAVDPGRVDQHLDGAVPRLRRRPVAGRRSGRGLRDAELLHRRGRFVASLLPWLLAKAGVANTAGPRRQVPDTVRYAFYAGGLVLFGAIGWTVLRTREYPPEVLGRVRRQRPRPAVRRRRACAGRCVTPSRVPWLVAGGHRRGGSCSARAGDKDAVRACRWHAIAYGFALPSCSRTLLQLGQQCVHPIIGDLRDDAATMRAARGRAVLLVVRAVRDVDLHHRGGDRQVAFRQQRSHSAAYNEGANWVGVLFAAYNGFAALAAIAIPWMVRALGLRLSHLVNSVLGGLPACCRSCWIRDPQWLLLSMVGVGFAWASILSLPVRDCSPTACRPTKMGIYMGIFNFFIVIPQLVAASLLGFLLKSLARRPADQRARARRHQPARRRPVRLAGARSRLRAPLEESDQDANDHAP
jgi:maltose/moltooligosaccharide transporter